MAIFKHLPNQNYKVGALKLRNKISNAEGQRHALVPRHEASPQGRA